MTSKFNIELIYITSVVTALGLLFFANSENIEYSGIQTVSLGIGKSFYFPCVIALISSFFLKKRQDNYGRLFYILIVLGLVSSLLHPPLKSNPITWTLTRFTFAILCFKDIRLINPYSFTKIATIASPFIIIPHYIITNPFSYGAHRYAGFYGDSNFLAIALILLIVCSYITIKSENNKFFIILGYFSILISIPLIFVGMSRGGLIGLALILLVIISDLRKTNKKVYVIILVCFLLSIGSVLENFSDLFSSISSRFLNESDSDEYSTLARIYGIQSALNVLTNYPIVIPFGIGLGNTVPAASEYVKYGCFYKAEIHNTFVSMMYEGGLIMVSIYLYIYIKVFRSLYKYRNYLLLAMLLSLFFSLNTLPGVSFMPGWISLFLLCNEKILIINGTIKK